MSVSSAGPGGGENPQWVSAWTTESALSGARVPAGSAGEGSEENLRTPGVCGPQLACDCGQSRE